MSVDGCLKVAKLKSAKGGAAMKQQFLQSGYAALAVAALFLAACGAVENKNSDSPSERVSVTGGKIEGVRLAGDVQAFRGVPFSAPPVGHLRWRAPQTVLPWEGVRSTKQFAPACMQNRLGAYLSGGRAGVSEDCLYLNIWAPRSESGKKAPVIVYLYGGAFAGGTPATPAFEGARLARSAEMVVVTVPYRLGAFGMLAHPELSSETGHGSGTWALQDVVAALQWIKANIGAFGGDTQRVTLWGQSSGAIAAMMLAAAPPARGLFHAVIAESGGAFAPVGSNSQRGTLVPTLKKAESDGVAFLSGLGVGTIAEARRLDAAAIQSAKAGLFWPVADGYFVPDHPGEVYANRRFNDVPILAGWNADDAIFPGTGGIAEFTQSAQEKFGPFASKIMAVYPHATDSEARQSGRSLQRDILFGWPIRSLARAQTQYGHQPVYVYYYDGARKNRPAGATHGAEAGFVFDNNVDSSDVATASVMRDYFVNFARTGNPNKGTLPQWRAYSPKNEEVMSFDPVGIRPYPNRNAFSALDKFFEAK